MCIHILLDAAAHFQAFSIMRHVWGIWAWGASRGFQGLAAKEKQEIGWTGSSSLSVRNEWIEE